MSNTYCIFSALYLPHIGGVENYTSHLAHELSVLGNHVIVVACNTEDAATVEKTSDATIYRLPCRNVMNGRFPLLSKNSEFKSLVREIGTHPIDRIIINTRFYPLSVFASRFAHSLGIVPLFIEHGSAHLTAGSPLVDKAVQSVEHSMTRRCKKYPARFFGVSQKAVLWLSHFDIKGEGVLSNSIDAQAFRDMASSRDFRKELNIASGDFIVGFTGRLVPEKGIQQLVVAAANPSCEKVHFVIAGDGPLMDTLKKEATNNVHFLGSLCREDVSAFLSQCDAFCMPTRSEGFSTSLLEAASCGLALISTDVGGVDELMPTSDYGIVLPSTDPSEIVSCVQSLFLDGDRAKELGKNVQRHVEENYNWAQIAQAVESLF